ncbi:AMP-binding protein [Frankia sp. AgB1.9]|uniref:AMP-binding protein n=1 Tax=unclassified Frankia TaxID=2632575 RepID=UPI0019320743|nr:MULTISPECIES: AMP-binding protein [unclassified Frankia]MBL7549215.1 AMP-binding protein [Frankia sp. AgB1.9]MBL7619432.1 AMP-binding protein [Frankia sp. AgB1.8]
MVATTGRSFAADAGSGDERWAPDPALAAARAYTWVTQLVRHAQQVPDQAALRFDGRTVTWSELADRASRVASALTRRGVRPGDRVATLMLNHVEHVTALLGAIWAGAIAVPVNFRLVGAEVAWILDNSAATALVVDAATAPVAAAAREQVPVEVCLVVGGDPTRAGTGAEDFEAAVAAEPELPDAAGAAGVAGGRFPYAQVQETDTFLLMYTSGTTGHPKGAMLTHLNLLMQAITALRSYQLSGPDMAVLVAAPLFHIAGVGALAPAMLTGGRAVIAPTGAFDPEAVIRLIATERVTSAFLVPTQWQAVCAVPGVRDLDLALRSMSWGASPAPASTLEAMASTFPAVANIAVFGQTEMSPVTCVLDGVDAPRKLGSIGKPVSTVAVRIVDEEMRDVPRGEVGEIVYRGPGLMAGYWRDPEATAAAYAGGWFHSGDLVREDDEGFLYVVDRKKDMIISGGENIYCAEVESAIAGHPKVRDVALIGVPHPRWVETPLAVIEPADPADPPTLDEILAWTKDRLASYKKPTAIQLVDLLPRNASGKIRKVDLRARFARRPANSAG